MHLYYFFARAVIQFFSFLFFPCRVVGAENIPKEGGFIFASNHLSYLDPILIGISTKRYINYMARDSLFRHPIFGFILKAGGAFPIKRATADRAALTSAIDRLEKATPLVIFPEGTRGGLGVEKKVNQGIGFLVQKAHIPVIPVYIQDSDKVLPPGAKFFHRHLITIRFGKPLSFDDSLSPKEIASQVMQQVYQLASS